MRNVVVLSVPVLVAAAVLLVGCMRPCVAQSATHEIGFDQYELDLGSAERPTILTGNFLESVSTAIVVVHTDSSDVARLKAFGFDGKAWDSVLDAKLDPEVLFVDVLNVDGRDRVISYGNGKISLFGPQIETNNTLVDVVTSYTNSNKNEIPRVDITRDVNHDGRDDLVVPDLDGFLVSVQLRNGTFSEFVKLSAPEPFLDQVPLDETRTYREVGITSLTIPLYLGRVHEIDYNQDGRSDLAFWRGDHFDVYYQDGRGSFDPVAGSFTADVPFDTDGAYSLLFGYSDVNKFSLISGFTKYTERTVLHAFRDMNGDGIADIVTHSLGGRSPLKQRSHYAVHFGASTPEGIVFTRDASTEIHPKGRAGGMQPWGYSSLWIRDFNNDGHVDIMFRDVNVGIGKMLRAMIANSITIDLEAYCGEDGFFQDRPSTFRKIRPALDPFGGKGPFFPTVMIGDVNGDGRTDLITSKRREELQVFVGVPGSGLFAKEPRRIAATLPQDERNSWLVDLTNDGKQDIIMHHASNSGQQRATVLVAR